jgi:hypothetical protein
MNRRYYRNPIPGSKAANRRNNRDALFLKAVFQVSFLLPSKVNEAGFNKATNSTLSGYTGLRLPRQQPLNFTAVPESICLSAPGKTGLPGIPFPFSHFYAGPKREISNFAIIY